ncbi:MAG: alpha/beta hydrolase [Henriciella sp.]
MLESWAVDNQEGFLAFDYSGHGASDGSFSDGSISKWREDVLDIITGLTDEPLVLVGSSMGGWLALLAAQSLSARVQALVLIAPAPDFTKALMWPSLEPEVQRQIVSEGQAWVPSDYGDPYLITHDLIRDGEKWLLMDKPFAFSGPVRILQGMKDEDVPWQHALRLVDTITSDDVVFTLIKDGDHRLSRDEDIQRLIDICRQV